MSPPTLRASFARLLADKGRVVAAALAGVALTLLHSAMIDLPKADVIDALDSAHAYSTRSLHAPFDEGGDDSLAEKLGEEELGYRDVEDGSLIATGLDALDDRERRIVELRFFDEMTQSQIAAEIGISQMHVSRLLRRALEVMRGRLEEPEVPA